MRWDEDDERIDDELADMPESKPEPPAKSKSGRSRKKR